MEMHRTISYQSRELHYRDEGREHSNTLVLLHDFMQNLDIWTPLMLSFMHHIRVITIDLPGHGHSSTFSDTHTMDFMARCVKAVLEDAAVDQCVMIGHGMGGYVALAFAEQYPYSLRGLGLLHSHAMPDSEEIMQQHAEACRQVATESRVSYILDHVQRLFSNSKSRDLYQEIKDMQDQCLEIRSEGLTAALKGMMQRPHRMDILQRLQTPVLFIFGKDDPFIPLEEAVCQAMVPHYSETMILDKVAHMAHIEEREYVKMRMLNFVNTCYA